MTEICEEGTIRLQGGSTGREGRVEICINETWSTVCDNKWSNVDANVTCRQLGYSTYGKSMHFNNFCIRRKLE